MAQEPVIAFLYLLQIALPSCLLKGITDYVLIKQQNVSYLRILAFQIKFNGSRRLGVGLDSKRVRPQFPEN